MRHKRYPIIQRAIRKLNAQLILIASDAEGWYAAEPQRLRASRRELSAKLRASSKR